MVTILTANDIVLNLIDFFNTTLPNADTKPGTVIRDLFIDAPSSQISLLYQQLSSISNLQSLRLVSGSDLDNLAQNYGATRKAATSSSGVALFTFASIPAVIAINTGSVVTTTSGLQFSVTNGVSVNPAQLNSYRSVAIKYQNNLNFLNITDQYAVEITVGASSPGSAGNISQYAINSTTITGVTNVTNILPFTGGTDQETDAAFRNRVLAIFSGSNVGTALGYQNLALSDPLVLDAYVVGPGNPLMTRDGTIVGTNAAGQPYIISDGTGGKVDVWVLGSNPSSYIDTFIYLDQSNKNDPTNPANNFVLGQIVGNSSLTISQRRVQDIANGVLPAQPVEEITQVTGSLSGANFQPESIDVYGRISGNYKLIKDTGFYSESAFGFDTFAWVNNQIAFQENIVKTTFNGQDATTFTDVLEIPAIQQNISITNENSLVSSTNRSIIQLIHTPATNVTRVFNVNTGERYTIVNQNVNGTGSINTSGVIQISGNTLPAANNILQVDYTWIVSYDPFSDYDGKILNNNPRPVEDSVDWGISNAIRSERILFIPNSTNTLYTGTSSLPVSSVIDAYTFSATAGIVVQSTVPNFTEQLAIVLPAIDVPINTVYSVKLTNTEQELFHTAEANGIVVNNTIVVGIELKYMVIIVLPTDTVAKIGDYADIEYNQSDTFNITNSTGSFISNQITIPYANIPIDTQVYLDVIYITSVQNILTAGITNFPLSRTGNGFFSNTSTGPLNDIQSDTIKRENQTIQQNISNQFYVELNLSSNYFLLDGYNVITVIDLATGLEIWNSDYQGEISIASNGNYELIFSGYNGPAIGDNVLAVYFATDINNTQPFTFGNYIFKKDFQSILFNFTTNQYYIPIQNFIVESGITFNIIDTTTGLTIGPEIDGYSDIDGYISATMNNNSQALFSSDTFNFGNIDDIYGKVIQIFHPHNINNDGIFSITAYNASTNTITIETVFSNLTADQVSVIGIQDNVDIWNPNTCTINILDNLLEMPSNTLTTQGTAVLVLLFASKNLHQSPSRIAITTTDQVQNTGIITVQGTVINEVQSVVFTAIENGLTQNVLSAIQTYLGLSNIGSIPNSYVVRVMQVKNVSITTNNIVLSTIATYDVLGTQIANNTLYTNEMVSNNTLTNLQFTLPATENNTTNAPVIGDTLQITFYYATDNVSENVYFTANGTQYTNNRFALVDQVYVSSGFSNSTSTKFTFAYFTQPATGTRYLASYNYLAPKQNERIVIQYNYNKIVSDTTFIVENQRPITADVLMKAALELLVDATVNVVISPSYANSAPIVLQNVQNTITSTINTNVLGGTLGSSNLISAAQTVSGVAYATISAFNQDGYAGQVISLTAQDNQYFVANNISIVQQGA